jgi:hypothetical protein
MVAASARGAESTRSWMVGGNFLETLAGETQTREALGGLRLRIHQDIIVTSAMLVEPSDTVLLLAGHDPLRVTRRRHGDLDRASDHLLSGDWRTTDWRGAAGVAGLRRRGGASAAGGRREGSLSRVAQAIRREIAEAVPLYAGIERLAARGDQVQWVGLICIHTGSSTRASGRAVAVVVPMVSRAQGPR